MLFALYCTDKPNSLELRLKTRAEHVAYLTSLGAAAKIGGPLLDDRGEMMGTLVIVEAADRAAAEKIAAHDPYVKAGLFQSVEIRGWRWVLNKPEVI